MPQRPVFRSMTSAVASGTEAGRQTVGGVLMRQNTGLVPLPAFTVVCGCGLDNERGLVRARLLGADLEAPDAEAGGLCRSYPLGEDGVVN